MILTVINNSQ